ncbi:MAG: hypothetical protein M0Q95_02425 [Porticoccaceae bacterium]|nr:hypothetical protein [Porticoccaceae bacterium]
MNEVHAQEPTPENGKEICIAIDPGGINQNSLCVAVLIAEKLKAGVYGLVVDNGLLQVAQLPFATEILISCGNERELATDRIDVFHRNCLLTITRMIEQSARQRQVRYRMESAAPLSSLHLVLSRGQSLFLPALKSRFPVRLRTDAEQLRIIKWVYDGSVECERSLALLEELVRAGITQTIFLLGKCAVPQRVIAELSRYGAKVFWLHTDSNADLFKQLVSVPTAGLMLLPGSLLETIGEWQLLQINRATAAAILVVS